MAPRDGGVERAEDRLNIQGSKAPIFYVALAEKMLSSLPTIHIHALGSCIESAVGVADRLQRNKLVTITKIKTDKGGRQESTAQIVISVTKTSEFDKLYEVQKKERESRAGEFAERQAEKDKKADDKKEAEGEKEEAK